MQLKREDFARFENLMQVRKFTIDTKRNYRSMLTKFSNEFKPNYKRATTDEIMAYISTMPSRASMAQMYGVLKNFYTYVLKQKRKFAFIPFPNKDNTLPYVPPHAQVLKMIDNTKNIKHKLIISILYGTGIRLSELINLRWIDIKREDSKENPLSIHVRGKGNKDRIVPLSENLYSLLKQYCKEYDLKCDTEKEHYIFGNEKPYSKKSVSKVVAKAGESIGIEISPHRLRHAAFTHLRNNGVDLADIAELAGHESMNTTKQYAKLSVNRIKMPI